MKKATKPKTATKAKISPYTASIRLLGKVYTATGETAGEAIAGLTPPNKALGTAILSVSVGKVTKERILNIIQIRRLFSQSRITREVALKNTITTFQGL